MSDRTHPAVACTGVRWALCVVGVVALALGIAGVFLPLLPTTVFLLIALWAFSRSSPRFHRWLYDHPRLGPPLRNWHRHRVIPVAAKAAAIAAMAGSLALAAALFGAQAWTTLLLAAVLAPVAVFILAQRSVTSANDSRAIDI